MSIQDSIASVIKSARELRTIADQLGQVELKSLIIDEIDRLQQLREKIAVASEPAKVPAAALDHIHALSDEQETVELTTQDSAMLVIKPSDDGDTYGLHEDEVPGEAQSDADETPALNANELDADAVRVSGDAELTDEQRIKRGEAILRKLEPRHQAALKKMNDILTDEQQLRKRTITRDGQAAGKSAQDIQQAVMAALELTDKQKQMMNAARKELQEIRAKIASGVEGLLSDDQRHRLQKLIARELTSGSR